MSISFILLSAVVCISIALCAYLFYSLPFIAPLLRARHHSFFDIRLMSLTFFFYAVTFLALEVVCTYQEGYSFFALPWLIQAIFFTVVTFFVLCALRLVGGDLLITAPPFYEEKVIPLHGTFESDSALFLEIIADKKGEVVLDALDKKIIIARLPLSSFNVGSQGQEVMIECTFSEKFLKNSMVQIVCYPASRGVFIEKSTMQLVLESLELLYTEKILESLV